MTDCLRCTLQSNSITACAAKDAATVQITNAKKSGAEFDTTSCNCHIHSFPEHADLLKGSTLEIDQKHSGPQNNFTDRFKTISSSTIYSVDEISKRFDKIKQQLETRGPNYSCLQLTLALDPDASCVKTWTMPNHILAIN